MKVNIGPYPTGINERKVNVTIEKFDTWNCDGTLAEIIYPMLCQLRDTKHSIPNEFSDVGGEPYSSQKSFDFYEDSHEEAFSIGIERWDEVLEKMIWSFEQLLQEDYPEKYKHGNGDYIFESAEKMLPNLFTGVLEPTFKIVDTNPNEHWVDYVGIELHKIRIQEGIDLFAKYYRSLWD
jgi:hypothetical protein